MMEINGNPLLHNYPGESGNTTNEVIPSFFPSEAYAIITWYQKYLPQSVLFVQELASYVITTVQRGNSLDTFASTKPTQSQLYGTANLLTYFHRQSDILVVAETVPEESLDPYEDAGISFEQIEDATFLQAQVTTIAHLLEFMARLQTKTGGIHEQEIDQAIYRRFQQESIGNAAKRLITSTNLQVITDFIQNGGREVTLLESTDRLRGERMRALYKRRPDLFARFQNEAAARRGYDSTAKYILRSTFPVSANQEIEDIIREETKGIIQATFPDVTQEELRRLKLTA